MKPGMCRSYSQAGLMIVKTLALFAALMWFLDRVAIPFFAAIASGAWR